MLARIADRMIDEATIEARAGNGGNGMVTFLREALRPLGGPAGGNGGNGGSVYITADSSINTLLKFRWRRHFIATNGGNGARNKKRGADGKNVEITVPVGTEVSMLNPDPDTNHNSNSETTNYAFIGDLVKPRQRLLVARGGRGGMGNAEFVTPVNREPLLGEHGGNGETIQLRLNLKILADVGIVGMPNAGKSSLLDAISAANPKIADYPFTTLEPTIGIVEHGFDAFAAVDIPGLTEGAAAGHGLGHEFLKHMQRTRLLIHVVDGSTDDIANAIRSIDRELAAYDETLARRPQIIAVNKSDLEDVDVLRAEITDVVRDIAGDNRPLFFISAATRSGLEDLINVTAYKLAEIREASPQNISTYNTSTDIYNYERGYDGNDDEDPLSRDDLLVIKPLASRGIVFKRNDGAYRIVHDRAVRLAKGSNLDNWDALVQFQHWLDRTGVTDALRNAGAKSGDLILVGDWEFEWQ